MAIIKTEYHKGSFPYWWVVRNVEEDRFNSKSRVTLSLYHSAEAYMLSKVDNILYEVAVDVPNIGLSNDEITAWVVSNNQRFKTGTDTGSNFEISITQSPVFVIDPNKDPVNGLNRAIEAVYYTKSLNSKMLLLVMEVHFYPNIQAPNPDFEEQFEERNIVDGEGNVIGTENVLINEHERFITVSADNYDPALDRHIAWEVDNFYQVAEGVGELDYFNSLITQGMTIEEVLVIGIGYGLQKGYVNKHLYGII